MSLLFEKMYLKFLKKHNIHTDYLWYEYYLCLYDSVFTSYIICILISDNKLELNPYNLICKSIYDNKKLVEIAKQHNCWLEDDCVLNLDSFSYVISDIISDYFLKIIEIDYNKGFLLLCEFIKEREKYSIKEIIDKYTKDLSYTETSIKNVIEKGKIYQKNVFLE